MSNRRRRSTSKTPFGRYIERDTLSTRVLAPPGGASSISLSWEQPTNVTDNHAHQGGQAIAGSWSAPTHSQYDYDYGGSGATGGSPHNAAYQYQELRSPARGSQTSQATSYSHQSPSQHDRYDRNHHVQASPQHPLHTYRQQMGAIPDSRMMPLQYADDGRGNVDHGYGYGGDSTVDSSVYQQMIDDTKQQLIDEQNSRFRYSDSAYVAESGAVHDSLSSFMKSPGGGNGHSVTSGSAKAQKPYVRGSIRKKKKKKKKSTQPLAFGSSQASSRGFSSLGQSHSPPQYRSNKSLAQRRDEEIMAAKYKHKVLQAAKASGDRIGSPRSWRNSPLPSFVQEAEYDTRRDSAARRVDARYKNFQDSSPLRELSRPLLPADSGW